MPSMYAVSVGVFTRQLTNLLAQLEKAEAYAAERKFKIDTLAHQRLFWDMHPLTFQVQNATDHAKGAAGESAPHHGELVAVSQQSGAVHLDASMW